MIPKAAPAFSALGLLVADYLVEKLRASLGSTKPPAPKARRDAYFGGRFRKTAIYDGPLLRPGQKVAGPAVIEERFTTIVVPPGWTVKLDKLGTYVGSAK